MIIYDLLSVIVGAGVTFAIVLFVVGEVRGEIRSEAQTEVRSKHV